MNWEYKPGECVTWQATHKKIGNLDTGYVIACLSATSSAIDTDHAREAAKILSDLGFDKPSYFFLKKLETVAATSQRDRYLIWVPSKSGKSGRFQTPVKRVVEREPNCQFP